MGTAPTAFWALEHKLVSVAGRADLRRLTTVNGVGPGASQATLQSL
jgi:hypothetical protein